MPNPHTSRAASDRRLLGFRPFGSSPLGFRPFGSRPLGRRRFCLPRFTTPGAPHSLRFHLIRGRILLGLGLYEQAISDFRNALRLDWRDERAACWLYKAKCALQHASPSGPLPQA